MSLHFWSLGLVLAVEELGESPPLNGMNAARKTEWIQKALVDRWELQREEKPRRWGGQTTGDSSKELDTCGELPARDPLKLKCTSAHLAEEEITSLETGGGTTRGPQEAGR